MAKYKYSLREKADAFIRENPEKQLDEVSHKEIAEWIVKKYPEDAEMKIHDSKKIKNKNDVIAQYASELPKNWRAALNDYKAGRRATTRVSTIPSEQKMGEKSDGDNTGIPLFECFLLPALKLMRDDQERHRREIFDCLNTEFQFSEEDKKQKYEKSGVYKLDGRMDWALRYLKHAGLLENTVRGYFKITVQGQEVLREHPDTLDKKIILQYAPADSKFFHPQKRDKGQINNEQESDRYLESYQQPIELIYGLDEDLESSQTPIELIEENYQKLKNSLSDGLLQEIKKRDPGFFEKLVIDLLIAMGYGGSRKEAGEAIGKSHDGGIDGIIKEDKLGLDIIYLQAKRYDSGSIGSPQIRNFIGALTEKHAQKGIFITTTSYTTRAKECVKNIPQKIILIDGDKLLSLMIEYNIGVSKASKERTYEIKEIDLDYFE